MGRGGATFRTWSGPEGSSHKEPLTSALAYSRYFRVMGTIETAKDFMEIVQFFIDLLHYPRGFIADWIAPLGPWAYGSIIFILLGYFFGNISFVQEHFAFIIIGIIVVLLIPTVGGLLKAKFDKTREESVDTDGAKMKEKLAGASSMLLIESVVAVQVAKESE